jgi:hypothetical protein
MCDFTTAMVFVNIAGLTIPRENDGMSLSPQEQESLKVVAKEAAREAVEQMSLKLAERDAELRESIVDDVRKELKSYFGDQSAAQHMIQHARIDKFLNWMDGMGKNFWGSLVSSTLRVLITAAISVFLYSKYKG